MSGCLLAFLIVLGLFVVSGAVGAFLIYREFGEFVGAAGEAMAEVTKGQKAPGAKEIRALGCEEASVIDGARMVAIAQRVENEMAKRDHREPKKLPADTVSTIVYCKNNLGKTPTCDEVAKTYVDAASPSDPFVVNVNHLNVNECSTSYSKDGKETGKATVPDLPSGK